MNLTKTRNTTKYLAIKELSDENKTYSISALCEFAGIARSAYYNWLDHVNSDNDNLNERIADTITKIHDEHPDMGYRRIRDTLAHDYKIAVNDKRVLRICRKKKIQSYIKHRYNCCTKPASDPAYVAENILNREFKSDMINQKWVTDISEFKYGVGEDDKKGKLYLSIILDLCDRRPVAFVYSTRNDNPLVFDTFDKAVAANPGATPLLHSDRGYQYTSKAFRRRILAAGMTQSMSRVARCIDNGPMEGFSINGLPTVRHLPQHLIHDFPLFVLNLNFFCLAASVKIVHRIRNFFCNLDHFSINICVVLSFVKIWVFNIHIRSS